jgi:predicted esterase
MKARVQALVAASVLFVLSACGGGSSSNSTNVTSPPLQQYLQCVSTAPFNLGNPKAPVIALNGPRVVSQPLGAAYVDAGATAADPKDGDISSKIVVTGLKTLNVNAAGDYMIRYDVTDSIGLPAAEVVRMVRVNAGKFTEQTARDMGTTAAHMAFYEHLPVNYSADPNQTFPVIFFRHGWGGARFTADGTAVQTPLSGLLQGDMAKMFNEGDWDDSRPFIVLSPQQCVDPLTFVVTAYQMKLFVDFAIGTYKIDTTRMYMAGYSQGSGNTWDYVNNYPQQLAAVVPMSGGYGTSVGCQLAKTPAWSFGAEDDPIVPYMDNVDTVDSINQCNPAEPALVTIFPSGGHGVVEEFLTIDLKGLGQGIEPYNVYNPDIYDWFLQHERSNPSPLAASRDKPGRAAPASAGPAAAPAR